jgi:hypothetical protein
LKNGLRSAPPCSADGIIDGMFGRKSKVTAGPAEVGGVELRCHHCQHANFSQRRVMLNTFGATFLGMDWANREAECYVCASCGFVHWFAL